MYIPSVAPVLNTIATLFHFSVIFWNNVKSTMKLETLFTSLGVSSYPQIFSTYGMGGHTCEEEIREQIGISYNLTLYMHANSC